MSRGGKAGLVVPPLLPRRTGTPDGCRRLLVPRDGKPGLSVSRGGRAGLIVPPVLPRRTGTPDGCWTLSLGCAVGGDGCGTVLAPLLPRRIGTPIGCRVDGFKSAWDAAGGATTPLRPPPRRPGTGALPIGWRGASCGGGTGRRGSRSSPSESLSSRTCSAERRRITGTLQCHGGTRRPLSYELVALLATAAN